MEYIDIDSSYRDRIRFPNQADFDLTHQQHHLCCPTGQLINPVSCQTIQYPNPQEFPQIAFFEETILKPLGQMVEIDYLPYMYATNTENVVQLDELVLRSTDPTTRAIVSSSLYPRNAVPLGENDEFYTGLVLEDVTYNEHRNITFYRYDDTSEEALYQSGEVLYELQVGNEYSLYTEVQTLDVPLSNIDRFYQGKYLKITSGDNVGSSRLIIDYIPGVNVNQFILATSFARPVTPYTTFEIVLDRKYYATIDRPFTNSLFSYPAFRNPTPDSTISWNSQLLASFTDTPIEFLSITNITKAVGAGVAVVVSNGLDDGAGNPLGNLIYIASTDDATQSWYTPITVFENVYVQDIAAVECGELPDLTFTVPWIEYAVPEASLPDPLNGNPFFIRATQSFSQNGQGGWPSNGGFDAEALATEALVPSPPAPYKGTTIQACSQLLINSAPKIHTAYSLYNAGNQPLLMYKEETIPYPPFSGTIIYTGLAGEVIHVYDVQIINGNPAIYYLRDTTPYYVRSNNASGTQMILSTHYQVNVNLLDSAVMTYAFGLQLTTINYNGNILPATLSVSSKTSPPFVVEEVATVGRLYLNIASDINGNVTPWDNILIWDNINPISGLRAAKVWQGTYRGQQVTLVFGIRDDVGLQVSSCFDDPLLLTSDFTYPIIIDSANIKDFDIIEDNSGQLIIVYGRESVSNAGVYELVKLSLNEVELGIGRPYRIRQGAEYASGGAGTILDATQRSITLPTSLQQPNDKLYKNSYIHIYSPNIYTIPDPFGMFNDFRLITSYDTSTNTITLDRQLSYNPIPYGLPSVGASVVYLPFASFATLGTDESGQPVSFPGFTVGAAAQWLDSYTDTNGLTLENMLYSDGSVNSGLTRYVEEDVALQDIFQEQAQIPGVYETPITISIGFWVLFNSLASVQTVVSFNRLGFGDYFSFSYDFGGTNELAISISGVNIGSVPVLVDTWYNIAFVQNPVENNSFGQVFVNGVNVTSVNDVIQGASVIPEFMYVSHEDGSNWLDGYVKNVILSAGAWTQQEITNIYNNGLNNYTYAMAFELLTCVTDNYNPLDYNNTMVLNQNPTCYNVELTHLTLPNVLLKSGFGNRIAFYPYVYVVFESIDTHTTAKLYSNNPAVNKNRVIFKVPIRDTSTPDRAFFVNNYSGMSQIMKFKPSDNFHFSVLMYNGEIFETSATDTSPPLSPDPLLQVSATIGFRRVPPNQVQM